LHRCTGHGSKGFRFVCFTGAWTFLTYTWDDGSCIWCFTAVTGGDMAAQQVVGADFKELIELVDPIKVTFISLLLLGLSLQMLRETTQFLQRLANTIITTTHALPKPLPLFGYQSSITSYYFHPSFSALLIRFDCLFRNLTALLTQAPEVVFKSEDLL